MPGAIRHFSRFGASVACPYGGIASLVACAPGESRAIEGMNRGLLSLRPGRGDGDPERRPRPPRRSSLGEAPRQRRPCPPAESHRTRGCAQKGPVTAIPTAKSSAV